MPPPPTQPGPRIRRAHRSLHTHRLVELALDQPELRCSCSRFASNSACRPPIAAAAPWEPPWISPLLQQACLAAKIKGLTSGLCSSPRFRREWAPKRTSAYEDITEPRRGAE